MCHESLKVGLKTVCDTVWWFHIYILTVNIYHFESKEANTEVKCGRVAEITLLYTHSSTISLITGWINE